MKINVCYHLVTRQMEKTSLIFSFIGWVMLLEIEKLTFSVLCGSKKLQTNSIMKKMLISPANFSIYLRDWVRVHFNCSTVTWQTAVVPQGWSETCCHLSTFAKGSCRGICSPPGFSVQAFEKGSSLPLFLSWAFCQLWGSFLPLLHTSFRKRKVLLFHNSVLLVCAFKFCFWYFYLFTFTQEKCSFWIYTEVGCDIFMLLLNMEFKFVSCNVFFLPSYFSALWFNSFIIVLKSFQFIIFYMFSRLLNYIIKGAP